MHSRKIVSITVLVLMNASAFAQSADLLGVVRAYADTMLEHGRDVYGAEQSPLFASALDRRTLRLFEGTRLEAIRAIERGEWGIRNHDRALLGSNPMHQENLYQVLYALSDITGEARYAEEADKALTFFFEHAQSTETGLFSWGEHLFWNFNTESWCSSGANNPTGTHEFFRPWLLWEKSFALSPDPCRKFALGLWEHQIGDPRTGNFSRHASYLTHGPRTNSEYPRHGGFYLATWGHAYAQTKDPVFLKAIDRLHSYFEGRRNPKSGVIPSESAERSQGTRVWPMSNLSLAVDLWEVADLAPDDLGPKLRESARRIDEIFLATPHDLSEGGKGFVSLAVADTLESAGSWTTPWVGGYGLISDAGVANICLLRFKQNGEARLWNLAHAAAKRYLSAEPDTSKPLYPGAVADAVDLLVEVYGITKEEAFLKRAEALSAMAVAVFFEGSPLPKASSLHDHYEAITRGDSLAMVLLKTWLARHPQGDAVQLVWNDR
jgi:hypothetical protein